MADIRHRVSSSATAVPFMHHCSTKWAVHLLGLRAGLDGGEPTPFPDDPVISNWR